MFLKRFKLKQVYSEWEACEQVGDILKEKILQKENFEQEEFENDNSQHEQF